VKALTPEAVAFKLYMAGTTGGLLVQSPDLVKAELEAISKSGKVLAVHAEDEALRRKDPAENLEQHLRNRSNECEASAIRKIKAAAGECRLHICHVSAKESVPLVAGKANLTSEVTPHHLFLDKTCSAGTLAKVNPPLRRREDRQALFHALKEGTFDTIASDHAPHTLEEKQEDFDYAPSGMPGVETVLPMMLMLAKQNHLDLGGILKRLCERPGDIFGIKKGKLEVGFDADIVVVDMSAQSAITPERLHSKCGWTVYEGMPAIFPKAVFLRGEIMVENGSLVGERMGRDVVERTRTA
jgi:dihydroorotase